MTSKSSQKSGSHASGGYQYSMSLGVKDVGHDNWDFSENFFDCPIL